MRFLCLHGKGTNSDIFEAQLASLRSRISPGHTFDFVDAEADCPPAPGVDGFYPGPYIGWFPSYEPPSVKKVQESLKEIIEEDGPYDGVIAFSEGAALAASLLLCDEHSQREPTFKVGIFFNSVMVFSPSEELGVNISQKIKDQETKFAGYLHGMRSDASNPDRVPDIYAFTTEFPTRISVPTLHVIGSEDVFSEASRELTRLCPDKAEVLIHDGGHELPRAEASLDRCSELFETVVTLASIGGA
ncbi:EF-hand calcium-binding domain protein [Penicillium alfredii]|uniref:EF-hand calcium-binding domain protein n=1 Tax=Penicillium alfredii TaxID=1506179 RepID=A0A9W9F1G3_9EURO|nr:EF-hand calcium-binding domain protein [Penicillium alfredii]KAJ5091913.1 EF-hand calcium-binding domain protein [Penicillium alfredii]